jgi:hypothetical protein
MTENVLAEVTASPAMIATTEPLENPYTFVVGCPRSGTTLLQRMLNSHPSLAVGHEVRFVAETIERAMIGTDSPLTPAIVEHVVNHRSFHKLRLDENTVRGAASRSKTYSQFVSILFSEFAKKKGKRLAGEKTPHYVLSLPQLNTLFPRTKIIHLIRDGRDVALSARQWEHGPCKFELWRHEPIAACALWWAWHVKTGRCDGSKLGASVYKEVLYEDLVARTEETLRGLTDFLDLPYAPEMVSYHVGKVRHEPGLSAKESWMPPTAGLRDWRADLADRDTELFEALTGDLLSELGYERATQSTSPEIVKIADRCQESWAAEMKSRQDKLRRKGRRWLDLSA